MWNNQICEVNLYGCDTAPICIPNDQTKRFISVIISMPVRFRATILLTGFLMIELRYDPSGIPCFIKEIK
jgi:hypothetical protein